MWMQATTRMRRLIAMSVLLCPMAASAAELIWTGTQSLTSGSTANCGSGPTKWKVVMGDNYLAMTGESGGVWKFTNVKFKPDGSAQLKGKTDKGVPVTYEVDAGAGPRNIRRFWEGGLCVYTLTPQR
jgi:hypothetical protein